MSAADKQLQVWLATTPGVLVQAEESVPQTGTIDSDAQPVEEARPVHVPPWLAAMIQADEEGLAWTREALSVQTEHRDRANSERATAWAAIKASLEASEPALQHKPRVHGPSEENIAFEAASERLRVKLKAARVQFDQDWPSAPQPSVYLSSALSMQIRQKHERAQIARVLAPALEQWEQSVEAWEQAVKDGLAKRKTREQEARKEEVRRALAEEERLEGLRAEAKSFSMLDADGKLRRLP